MKTCALCTHQRTHGTQGTQGVRMARLGFSGCELLERWQTTPTGIKADCPDFNPRPQPQRQTCPLCGYEFDLERLGKYGCPNCLGEGLA
jgi:hypothetical protein